MGFQEGVVIVHVHDLNLEWIEGICLLIQRGAILHQVSHVKITIRLEEVKNRQDQGHEPLPHPSVLWFEFRISGGGVSEEDVLHHITGNHDRELRGDVKSMPDATQIVQVDFGGGG